MDYLAQRRRITDTRKKNPMETKEKERLKAIFDATPTIVGFFREGLDKAMDNAAPAPIRIKPVRDDGSRWWPGKHGGYMVKIGDEMLPSSLTLEQVQELNNSLREILREA
jgi:hypothetical protein